MKKAFELEIKPEPIKKTYNIIDASTHPKSYKIINPENTHKKTFKLPNNHI